MIIEVVFLDFHKFQKKLVSNESLKEKVGIVLESHVSIKKKQWKVEQFHALHMDHLLRLLSLTHFAHWLIWTRCRKRAPLCTAYSLCDSAHPYYRDVPHTTQRSPHIAQPTLHIKQHTHVVQKYCSVSIIHESHLRMHLCMP